MGSVAKLVHSSEGSERVLFQPERPVLTFMEDYVSGDGNLDIRHELTVQILTQIRDNLAMIGKKQDGLGVDLQTVSERVVRLEERNERFSRLEVAISKEAGRVDALMRDKDKRDGAVGLIDWVGKHWPFTAFAAVAAGYVAWANGKLGL